MVHTTAVAARLFGYAKPFVQGLFTANHVLHTLTRAAGRAPSRVAIGFARQIFVNQTVRVLYTDRAFEVCDAADNLMAFGDWQA
jgi:hypothetical protein